MINFTHNREAACYVTIMPRYLRLSLDALAAWTWVRSIGIAAAVGGTYFLAAQLSNSFLITPETVIFWPAAGISSGLLISLWSISRWPVLAGVMVATAAANLLRHFGVAATAAWVLGNTAEPLIIAGLMQHYFGAQFKIDRLYCVVGLFAAAVAGTAVASTWWTFVYYWLFASLNEPTATWLHWMVSDCAGIVSVAPLMIGIAAAMRRPPAWREAIESLAALAVLGAMSGVIVFLPLVLGDRSPGRAGISNFIVACRPMAAGLQRGGCLYRFHVGCFDRDLRPWPFWRLGSFDRRQSPADPGGHSGCGIRHGRPRRTVRRAKGERGTPRSLKHAAGARTREQANECAGGYRSDCSRNGTTPGRHHGKRWCGGAVA